MKKGQKHPTGWTWSETARQRIRDRNAPKVAAMVALFRDGSTLQQIGDQYGITRERVRQILAVASIGAKDGGQAVRARRRRAAANASRDGLYLKKHGCTVEQYRELRDYGRKLMAAGVSPPRAPLGAFASQKYNAARRGIEWRLTLWEWWTIWWASGHWNERGRGQGYCMCRHGDTGPYATGNVFIGLSRQNSSERKGKITGLPIGVFQGRKGFYRAARSITGKRVYLGTFRTPELAHAAYLRSFASEAA